MDCVKINTVSTVDAVRSALEQDILNIYYTPGAKITESNLSARYGVSRNTVREAIAHLLSQGLLTKVANKGVYVQRFTQEDIQEIFQLRCLLEQEAVRCILKNGNNISSLYTLVIQMEQTDRSTCWQEYVRLDIAFHVGLVDAAGSGRLKKLFDTILTEVKLCIYQTRNYVQVSGGNASTHRMILDALTGKDEERALALLEDHIAHVIKRYCAGISNMNQQG